MLSDRLKVAIPLILIVCLAFFLPGAYGKTFFILLAAAMLAGAVHEGCALTGLKSFGAQEILLYGFSACLLANICICHTTKVVDDMLIVSNFSPLVEVALLLFFLLGAFMTVFSRPVDQTSLRTVACTILVGVLICWQLSYIVRLFFTMPMLVAYLVAVTKMGDIGAYTFGSLSAKVLPGGNHKLSRYVSPKKSWEGLLGGCVFCIITSLIFLLCSKSLQFGWIQGILFGVVAAVFGLLGDLSESLLKRAAGVKDSGKLPGLGGVLDVLDSLLPMGPILYLWCFLPFF